MDELELLKKDWQKQEAGLPKLSYNELYKMILKRSSSIVKWIFIISIIEFVLWASIDIGARISGKYKEVEILGMENFSVLSTIVLYGVLIYFIIRFYLNYKKIKTTDSAKILMQNILKTRKTVRHYVWINLTAMGALMISTLMYLFFFNSETITHKELHPEISMVVLIVTCIVMVLVFVAVLALVYYFVYGLLTKKLKKNYKELERLEV